MVLYVLLVRKMRFMRKSTYKQRLLDGLCGYDYTSQEAQRGTITRKNTHKTRVFTKIGTIVRIVRETRNIRKNMHK